MLPHCIINCHSHRNLQFSTETNVTNSCYTCSHLHTKTIVFFMIRRSETGSGSCTVLPILSNCNGRQVQSYNVRSVHIPDDNSGSIFILLTG